MSTFHFEIPQNTAAWTTIRLGIPTASEMHRIITPKTGKLSTQSTGYRNRLLAEWVLGRPLEEEPYESEYMELGHSSEQSTVESFEFMTGMKTREVGFVSVGDPILYGCSPDRLIVRDDGEPMGTLEVKSVAPQTHMGYLMNPATLKEKYWVQVQAQLWICDLEFGYIHSDSKPLPPIDPVRVDRDEDFIFKLGEALALFIAELHVCRVRYVKAYGLPERKPLAIASDPVFAGMEVSLDDLEGWTT